MHSERSNGLVSRYTLHSVAKNPRGVLQKEWTFKLNHRHHATHIVDRCSARQIRRL